MTSRRRFLNGCSHGTVPDRRFARKARTHTLPPAERGGRVAAITPEFPIVGSPIIRGDPLTIPVNILVQHQPQDVSDWIWRAQIRRSYDSALIDEFTIEVITPVGGTVPNQVLLSLDTFQTVALKTGFVFDLEQLIEHATPETWRTWWIVQKINVQKDVSHQ
jgi:hypothetical protein